MTGAQLRDVLIASLPRLAVAGAELGALDAEVGDGDLGVTVEASCHAAVERLAGLHDNPSPADVVRVVAEALASANPSTLSTLTSAGLGGGAGILAGVDRVNRAIVLAFAESVAATIARLGRSGPGDKTVLDAVLPSIDALRAETGPPVAVLDRMIDAARSGIEVTRDKAPRRGRSAWLADRAVGHPDPGATAYLRFLEALRDGLLS